MKGIAVKTTSTSVPAKAHTKNGSLSGGRIGQLRFELFLIQTRGRNRDGYFHCLGSGVKLRQLWISWDTLTAELSLKLR
jgi:hypothetical protein